MNVKKLLPITAGTALCLVLLGFYSHQKISPEELGFYRAQIDDRGLLELTVDKIRQEVKTATLSRTVKHDAQQRTKDIRIDDSGHAVVRSTFADIGEVELTFRKVNDRWQVIEPDELSTDAKKSIGATPQIQRDEYELYSESGTESPRTLTRKPLNEEHGIEKLTERVTQQKIDRRLFEKPYAAVLFSSVTQLDHAPYFIARYVQLVTDPAWNRIVYGDYQGWMKAYGNERGSEDLNRPHGIDRDINGRVYVADTGNNRIVVLRLQGNGEETELTFLFAFGSEELNRPYDVAWDDRSTPFDPSDDIVWVADSGNHRILGYTLKGTEPALRYNYGVNGNGIASFFEPKGVAVGRFNGSSDGSLFVADTGNRRVVKLMVTETGLEWRSAFTGRDESQLTSIDVDHWGNVYVTDRSYLEIQKLTSGLQPLAKITGTAETIVDPVNFHVVFGEVNIPSENLRYWTGYDQGFLLEKWTETSGGERYHLGVDLQKYRIALDKELDAIRIRAKLTDHADVRVTIIDKKTNRTVRQIPLGWMVPGDKEIMWNRRDDIGWQVEPGFYRIQMTAESAYGTSEILKESPEFYLPLYYHADSGGDVHHDAQLVQGQRIAADEPHRSLARHPEEVIYRFNDLNPAVEYEIQTQFFKGEAGTLSQQLLADKIILADFSLSGGIHTGEWQPLPKETVADGTVEIRIRKTRGDLDAMISQLWLKETDYDPANPPAIQDDASQVPESYTLSQNYPNPFNPATTITFGVPEGSGHVKLRIFNVLGQTVKYLFDGQLQPGQHKVVWNGTDNSGRQISTGVYFYELQAGDFRDVKKMILMK